MSGVAPKKALGQHFLVDPNVLGVIGRLAASRPTTSCSRWALAGCPHDLSRRSRASRARDRGRPQPRAGARGGSGGTPARAACVRRRALDRSRSARAPADEARRQPPVQHRDATVAETLAGAPTLEKCVMVQREVADRFFAEPDEGLRGSVRPSAPACAAHGVPRRVAHCVPPAAERRLGPRRLRPHPAARERRPCSSRGLRRVRAPPQDAPGTAPHSPELPRASRPSLRSMTGRRPDTRAEALDPDEFVWLVELDT